MKSPLLTVGYDKNGELDFGVCAAVCGLSYNQMKDFREMIIVGIGIAEDMWRREQSQDPSQTPSQEVL